jgi:hypothetical protein
VTDNTIRNKKRRHKYAISDHTARNEQRRRCTDETKEESEQRRHKFEQKYWDAHNNNINTNPFPMPPVQELDERSEPS